VLWQGTLTVSLMSDLSRPPLASLQALIPGKPFAWPRPNSRGRQRFNPQRYAAWQQTAAEALAAQARWRTFPGEVAVNIFVYEDGVVVSAAGLPTERRQQRPKGIRGDLDNYAKAVIDAMQVAGVMANDRQMVTLEASFIPRRKFT